MFESSDKDLNAYNKNNSKMLEICLKQIKNISLNLKKERIPKKKKTLELKNN